MATVTMTDLRQSHGIVSVRVVGETAFDVQMEVLRLKRSAFRKQHYAQFEEYPAPLGDQWIACGVMAETVKEPQ